MKFAILNYSGNVGKTTIARDMLKLNLPDFRLVSVESVNSDGKEETIIKGENGDALFAEMLVNDKLILDIGSSNLEKYLERSLEDNELLTDIDFFILPVTPQRKQQADTLKTVDDLIRLGVLRSQLFLIFNQVGEGGVEEEFGALLAAFRKADIKTDIRNSIRRHDLYETGKQLAELVDDKDYRDLMQQAKNADDIDKAREYAYLHIRQKRVNALVDCYQGILGRLLESIRD